MKPELFENSKVKLVSLLISARLRYHLPSATIHNVADQCSQMKTSSLGGKIRREGSLV